MPTCTHESPMPADAYDKEQWSHIDCSYDSDGRLYCNACGHRGAGYFTMPLAAVLAKERTELVSGYVLALTKRLEELEDTERKYKALEAELRRIAHILHILSTNTSGLLGSPSAAYLSAEEFVLAALRES